MNGVSYLTPGGSIFCDSRDHSTSPINCILTSSWGDITVDFFESPLPVACYHQDFNPLITLPTQITNDLRTWNRVINSEPSRLVFPKHEIKNPRQWKCPIEDWLEAYLAQSDATSLAIGTAVLSMFAV